jgi:hypothetical protein
MTGVKPPTGLAPEPTRLDILHHQWTGTVPRTAQPLVWRPGDGQDRIQADLVGELERAHRIVVARFDRGVDVRDGAHDARQDIARLGQERAKRANGRPPMATDHC